MLYCQLLKSLYTNRRHNIEKKQYPPIEKGSDERQLSFNFSVVTLLNRPTKKQKQH